MITLTLIQAASFACQAGFHGTSLYNILAIARFESGLNIQAENLQDANGGSYGILQINGIHFGEAWTAGEGGHMSKEQALDPGQSFKFAYWLSKQGTDFGPWSTWKKVTADTRYYLAEELMHNGVKFLCQIQPS